MDFQEVMHLKHLSKTIRPKGGKTVKIEAWISENKLEKVMFSGDFFAYPAEALEELEQMLAGSPLNVEEIKSVFKQYKGKVSLVGASLNVLEKELLRLLGLSAE